MVNKTETVWVFITALVLITITAVPRANAIPRSKICILYSKKSQPFVSIKQMRSSSAPQQINFSQSEVVVSALSAPTLSAGKTNYHGLFRNASHIRSMGGVLQLPAKRRALGFTLRFGSGVGTLVADFGSKGAFKIEHSLKLADLVALMRIAKGSPNGRALLSLIEPKADQKLRCVRRSTRSWLAAFGDFQKDASDALLRSWIEADLEVAFAFAQAKEAQRKQCASLCQKNCHGNRLCRLRCLYSRPCWRVRAVATSLVEGGFAGVKRSGNGVKLEADIRWKIIRRAGHRLVSWSKWTKRLQQLQRRHVHNETFSDSMAALGMFSSIYNTDPDTFTALYVEAKSRLGTNKPRKSCKVFVIPKRNFSRHRVDRRRVRRAIIACFQPTENAPRPNTTHDWMNDE